jgi:hypothetical protein
MSGQRAQDRARYRVRQFFQALGAAFVPVDDAYVAGKLAHTTSAAVLLHLFHTMSRVEQHHGIDVCRILDAQGQAHPDLQIAALLHDVGKASTRPRLWERVLVVLVEYLAPHRAESWGRTPANGDRAPRGFHRAFVVRRNHALWGARRAEEAGASPRAVALIRHHHDEPSNLIRGAKGYEVELDLDQLATLQAADEA